MVGIYIKNKHDFKEAIADLVSLGFTFGTICTLTGVPEHKLQIWFQELGFPTEIQTNNNTQSSFALNASEVSAIHKSDPIELNSKDPRLQLKRKYDNAFTSDINDNNKTTDVTNKRIVGIDKMPLGSKNWLMNLMIEESSDEEESDGDYKYGAQIDNDTGTMSSLRLKSLMLIKIEQEKRLEELKQKIKERETMNHNKIQTKTELNNYSRGEKMNKVLKVKKEILVNKIEIKKISQYLQDKLSEIKENEEKIRMSRQQVKQIRKYIKQFKSQINESRNICNEFEKNKRDLEQKLQVLENELQSNEFHFGKEKVPPSSNRNILAEACGSKIRNGIGSEIRYSLAKEMRMDDESVDNTSSKNDMQIQSTDKNVKISSKQGQIIETCGSMTKFVKHTDNEFVDPFYKEATKVALVCSSNKIEQMSNGNITSTHKIDTNKVPGISGNSVTTISSQPPTGFLPVNSLNHTLVSVKDIDYSKPFCTAETSGGVCNDPSCTFQHFKIVEVTSDMITGEINRRLKYLTSKDKVIQQEKLRIFLEKNVQKIKDNYSLLRLVRDFFDN